jgi:tetratricopeptide (TPR) repeat protein
VTFSPDGRLLVTAGGSAAGNKGEARVWDAQTGQQLTPPLLHQAIIRSVSFSPDGRRLVTTALHDRTGAVQVWDVSAGRPALTFSRFGKFPLFDALHATFSPDGRRLVVASLQGAAQVLDLVTGETVGPPLKHDNWVWHAAFSADGRRVVTASRDRTARVWEVGTGKPLTPPLRHRNYVLDASFSPDGRFVVTAAADGTARVWAAADGVPVTPPLQHSPMLYVNRARFSPDGKRVFTEAANRMAERFFGYAATPRGVWVWDLSAEDRPAHEAALLAEWLAGRRLDATGSYVPLNWSDALEHLNVLVASRPGEWPLLYRRGRAHAGKGQWEQAIADYTRAIELGARDAEVYYHRAEAHVERKQWVEAVADASTALELGAEELQARGQRAIAHRWLGRYDLMIADYTRVLELYPDQGVAWSARGFAHAALGQWDRAEADYAKAHEVGTVPSFECQRVLLRLAVNDLPGYHKARAGLLEWAGPNPNPDTALWVAWACVLVPDAGADPARLLQLAERAAVVAPNTRDSLLIRGAALYRAGKCEEAVRVLDELRAVAQGAQTQGPSSERSSPQAFDETAYELFYLAMAHLRLGHADEARQWLDKGVRWMEQARLPKTEDGTDNPRYSWNRRVTSEVLRREAEALLQGAKP